MNTENSLYNYKIIFFLIIFCMFITVNISAKIGPVTLLEIPSSFNPVGSGARALGFGGAFIAIADDATAASWNPGGLSCLVLPEFSIVTGVTYRKESNRFNSYPEASDSHRISEEEINYLSFVYPFAINNYNMVIAITYQRLYELYRNWDYSYTTQTDSFSFLTNQVYVQSGSLSAFGVSYCLELNPNFSLGITFNFWKNGLTDNNWKQKYDIKISGAQNEAPIYGYLNKTEEYEFDGFNMNIGTMWYINKKLSFGTVLKTKVNADIDHRINERWEEISPDFPETNQFGSRDESRAEYLTLPMSYGIGVAYKFSDDLILSGDIYRTCWSDFVLKLKNKSGYEINPISGKPSQTSEMDSTTQIRIGGEYILAKKPNKSATLIRAGIFFDPAPTVKGHDNFYGCALGLGYTNINILTIDCTLQYRTGNGIGESYLEHMNFSQDVREYKLYFSSILYL